MGDAEHPPRRYLSAEQRKREIIEVAAPLFFSRGYEGTELAEVARRAGVSRALLHRHFGGKRQLLLGVIEGIVAVEPAHLCDDPGVPIERRIEHNTDAWLDHFEANRNLIAVTYQPLSRDPEVVAMVEGVRERIIDRILVNYAGSGGVSETLRVAMRGLVAFVLTICEEWLWEERIGRRQVRALMIAAFGGLFERALPALAAESGGTPSATGSPG